MEIHTIAYSKSHRENKDTGEKWIDARGKIDDEGNTLSCGDGCTNQSTGNYVFTKEDMSKEQEQKILKLASVDNQTRKEHVKSGTIPEVDINVEAGKCIATRHLGRNGKLESDLSSTIQVAETPHITDSEIRIRKLTPLECERLMSWPDSHTKYGVDEKGNQYELSNSARYKACGNGIVSNIPKALLDLITGDETGLRIFSTFAGVDGSGLYLESPKYVKVGFAEYEPKMKAQHAANVLRYHYPEVPNLGDITKVRVEDVPDHDIIFISAPCQSFSSAGSNMGIEDTRGTLFYETARIMQAKRPKYFIFENVKGLLTKKHEKTFEIMCEVYSSLGYDIDFELINAKHYGVAQNRERVFMIGKLRD